MSRTRPRSGGWSKPEPAPRAADVGRHGSALEKDLRTLAAGSNTTSAPPRAGAMLIADTGPLVAAANRRDEAHRLAAALISSAGREVGIPDPVAVETDWALRAQVGPEAARAFWRALTDGEYRRIVLTDPLLARALEIDVRYAALDLGIVDASVMAVAEAQRAAILTFDFTHFRAAPPARDRAWRLVIDEATYSREVRRR